MELEKVKTKVFPRNTVAYSTRDVMLYALSVGAGEDPLDETDLHFVYEKELSALPTFACVLGSPGFWWSDPALAVDWPRLLHGEQSIEMHRPLEPEGVVTASYRVVAVKDGGPAKGATVHFERLLWTEAGEPLCTVLSSFVLRGDGGCGDFGEAPAGPDKLPDREPDRRLELASSPSQALLYRLNGDPNPLHVDPAVARVAGFDRPILHGLCTMGIVCRALVRSYCDGRPERMSGMFVRFTSPMFPGEKLRLECFDEPDGLRFRARSVDRDVVVIDRGRASIRP